MKIISWNVNGIRASERKGFLEWLKATNADIVAVQETKARPDQLGMFLLHPAGWHTYWHSAERPGYSGTALFTRVEPLSVQHDFPKPCFKGEGRIQLAEYENFF